MKLLSVPLLSTLISSGLALSTPILQQRDDHTFDYVIVGGGTAGLVLANRLSADGTSQVAVVEAGSYYQISGPGLSTTPAGDSYWIGADPSDTNSGVDWDFVTQPQAGANNRVIHYARGKCLGGSSARNFMIYQRPTRGSLQQWATNVGDSSYTFDQFLPYFKRSVHFTSPNTTLRAGNASAQYNAIAFDPSAGLLQVSYANFAGPFSSYMQGSLNELGMQSNQDFNTGKLFGHQYCSSTISPINENRDSSQTSFLDAASSRSNLHVYRNTKAKKILFDANKKAIGVSVASGFVRYTITAKKEVILSAGAFQSPQLLMVSGIGPSDQLSKLNIPIISTLPGVGQNMWDHIFFGPTYRVNVPTLTKLANDFFYVAGQFLGDYSIRKKGPLTNPIADFLAWEKVPLALRSAFTPATTSNLATFASDWPEIEWLSAPGYVGNFSSLPNSQPKDGYQYATILMALVAPVSRGNVTIASADTDDLPLINPAWLTSPTDQQVAVAAYKRARAAFRTNFMGKVLTDKTEYFPGPAVQSDAQILSTIRDTLMTVWHAACTCKMGKASDPMAVVDRSARVFGVTGLRVVDASAFPILPPGHPQSTVYALAEKIADLIIRGQ